MKLDNKKTNIFLDTETDKHATYSELMLLCINQPSTGIPSSDMKAIGTLIEKLEGLTGKKSITMTEEEYQAITPILLSYRWPAYHKDLEQFIKDFQEVK